MKKIFIGLNGLITGMTLAALGAEPSPSPAVVATNAAAPKIKFAMPIYDFGRAKSGEAVKYDFVFTNVGQATLEVSAVRPGCGCTTAGEWTHKVEPGQTGHIPIQFNAGGYSGMVTKGVTVTCNDASQPTVSLQIKGTIWRPVDVMPQYAVLNGTAQTLSNATATVRIVNNEDSPLTLFAPEINNPIFSAELRTNEPGKAFDMIIRLARPLESGNASGLITLKSSSTNVPVVTVNATAILQPTVVTTPPTLSPSITPRTNKFPVLQGPRAAL
jgi:hypothetical protein